MSPSTDSVAGVVAALTLAADDDSWGEAYRRGFARLGGSLQLHPAGSPAQAFASAAATARELAVECLPLSLAAVMHLYPLCALRCVPLPWWSAAARRRAGLLRAIDTRRLILANAGSERAAGAHPPVAVTRHPDGLHIDGRFDFVSLAHVADIVLFSAPLADGHAVFCAADMHSPSVRIGNGRFSGSMRLSDTCSVAFGDHRVTSDYFIEIPTESTLQCMAQYQRSWFQLLLGESYLARIDHLHGALDLPRPKEQLASLNEVAHMREYALHLLNDASTSAIESLSRVSNAMKLRISWLAQATAEWVRPLDEVSAQELGFLRRQPTPDDRILASLGAAARISGPTDPAPPPPSVRARGRDWASVREARDGAPGSAR